MRKFCRNCGAPADRTDAYCRVCGSGLLAYYEPPRGKGRAIGSTAIWYAIWLACQTAVTLVFLIPAMVSAFSESLSDYSYYDLVDRILEGFLRYENAVSIIYTVLFVGVVAIVFSVMQKKRDRLGVVPQKNLFREIGVTGAPVSVCLCCVAVGAALNRVVSFIVDVIPWPESFIDSFDSTYEGLLGNSDPMWVVILSAAVCAPLCEEVLFRGIACSRLRGPFPHVIAVLTSSLVFGVAHGTPIAIAYATVFGVVQACIFLRHRSLLPVIICHFAFNLTALLSTETYGSSVLNLALFFIAAAVCFGGIWFVTKKPSANDNTEDNASV